MIQVLKVFEYDIVCDRCGANEVLHTGDSDSEIYGEIYVHNIHTAIKLAGFHRSKGRLLCGECWERGKRREENG